MLIYQTLHLAKLLPVTDTLMKMGLLSVNDLLEKRRLRTKWAKNILNDTKKHFKNPDIIKYRRKHEELPACYPKLWSEKAARCYGF
ncbi:hypothetical protein HMPREF0542_10559 [Ligilactobacillus ruminis ATCC 25644]|uniref:Uncharacterized protein n=1 Tax=Ligilactobacillus ruminis ATCC 25644 TaxID=525362 RepID=E7FNT2_9LACO|nr:hypothetical protein HMPREF0542_10559 [Ligilactobacillus ruminis ATCC 25644]EGX97820.1 hypothetical protein ANHS_1581 [Ligilactobacillus ruminis ATCC 25644]